MSYVYLIHIEPAFHKARHYIGYTERDVGVRFEEHLRGQGSALLRYALAAGHTIRLARVWVATKTFEYYLKNTYKRSFQLCPICNPERAQRFLKGDYGQFHRTITTRRR